MYTTQIKSKTTSGLKNLLLSAFALFAFLTAYSQEERIKWSNSGNTYFTTEKNELIQHSLPGNETKVIISKAQLTPHGSLTPLKLRFYSFSADNQKALIFTNTKRVWRLNSKGDYWVLNLATGDLTQLGKSLPSSSLMFAKFSPDGKSVAYVSGNNIYVEDLATAQIKALTKDGTVTLINGTFDWAYEEEFACRDGIRWSPDSKSIAYWQIDAGSIKKFYMINNTDSIYSQAIPIEYPKVGEKPSACKVGVVTIADVKTTWVNIPGDPAQHYIVRMEYIPASDRKSVV